VIEAALELRGLLKHPPKRAPPPPRRDSERSKWFGGLQVMFERNLRHVRE
jgi:hypothetical protein